MKKGNIVIGITFFMMFFLTSSIYAEDFSFNVGLRTWYNDWEVVSDSGGSDTSDSTFMLGPNFKLSYGKFFGGVSFMTTMSDYKFSDSKWPRYDLDAMLGYMVHPRLGLIAGWKYIRGTSSTRTSHSVYGPVFGFTFNYPIPIEVLKLTFYLNGAFMPLEGELKYSGAASETNYDIIGYSGEAGFAYALIDDLSISLGYKYQNLDWRPLAEDILSGVTFGINYPF